MDTNRPLYSAIILMSIQTRNVRTSEPEASTNQRRESPMSDLMEQYSKAAEVAPEPVADTLAWLKAGQATLIYRLRSSLRAVLPGENRESSAWRALSAEYGPDEPISLAVWSDTSARPPQR